MLRWDRQVKDYTEGGLEGQRSRGRPNIRNFVDTERWIICGREAESQEGRRRWQPCRPARTGEDWRRDKRSRRYMKLQNKMLLRKRPVSMKKVNPITCGELLSPRTTGANQSIAKQAQLNWMQGKEPWQKKSWIYIYISGSVLKPRWPLARSKMFL